LKFILMTLFLSNLFFAQNDSLKSISSEEKFEFAFINAKKGIYWALNNLNEKKNSLKNDLINDDKLIASVSTSKEINGIKIESEGFYESVKVKITIFKSNESLLKEGYLKPDSLKSKSEIPAKKGRKKK